MTLRPGVYFAKIEPCSLSWPWHVWVEYRHDGLATNIFARYAKTKEVAVKMANEAIERHKEQRRRAERERAERLAETKTWTVEGDI